MSDNIIPIKTHSARDAARRPAPARTPKVIAITSGKGGVGKTNIASNLAIVLARAGRKVCLFDADTGLANINVIMGLNPVFTIEHVLRGERTIDEVLLSGPEGVAIIPAASGIAECANLTPRLQQHLIAALETLEERFDYILIDTGAGIGDSVLSFVQAAQYAVVVISTEPTSLTDAFALLRVLRRRNFERPVHVLVNMALNYANSMEVYKRFEAAVAKYLKLKVHYLGYITEDKAVRSAVRHQQPVVIQQPDALASRCFITLAAVLGKQFTTPADAHAFSRYWKQLASTAAPPAAEPPGAAPADRDGGAADRSADELQILIARALALANDPALGSSQIERLLAPLIQVYVDRFQRLPLKTPAELGTLLEHASYSAAEWRTLAGALTPVLRRHGALGEDSDEKSEQGRREAVLQRYQEIVERLGQQHATLDDALARLWQAIAEAAPKTSSNGADREVR